MKRITSLYSKETATRKGSDAAEGSGKRPRGRPGGRGKAGGKTRPPSPVPSSPSELPSAHSSSEEEEEVQVEEEAGVEEEIGVPLSLLRSVCGCEVPRPSRGDRYLLRDAR